MPLDLVLKLVMMPNPLEKKNVDLPHGTQPRAQIKGLIGKTVGPGLTGARKPVLNHRDYVLMVSHSLISLWL